MKNPSQHSSQTGAPDPRPQIAIVGAGFSGTMTALQILRQSDRPPVRISLIERSDSFGLGLAYGTNSERMLLNVRAAVMGAFPESPRDFFEWLTKNGYPAGENDYVPRLWYGKYLSHLLDNPQKSHAEDSLELILAEVEDVLPREQSPLWRVNLSNSRVLDANAVVFAFGNLPRHSIDGLKIETHFASPYDPRSYDQMSELREILIVGSSLTAVDAIVEAEHNGFRGRFSVLSRRGLFPQIHTSPFPPLREQIDWSAPRTTRGLVRLFVKLARELGDSQAVTESIRPESQNCWKALPLIEKKRFLRHVQPFWGSHRHRIPEDHSKLLNALKSTGRLRQIRGRLHRIENNGLRQLVTIQMRGAARQVSTEQFDRTILAIGPEQDIRRSHSILIQNLIERHLLIPGTLGLGCSVNPSSDTLHLVGPLQREALWEVTAVRELRVEAQATAHKICSQLKGSANDMRA